MATLSSQYGIYQWQGSDPVKREEFNHNFQVLEQELYSKNTFQPLFAVTNSNEAQMVSIDMSQVDWGRYHEVVVEIWHPVKTNSSGVLYVNKVTGSGSQTYGCVEAPSASVNLNTYEGLGRLDYHRGRMTIECNQHADAVVNSLVHSQGSQRIYIGWKMDLTVQQISTIDYYNYNKVPVGTVFTVWGVK